VGVLTPLSALKWLSDLFSKCVCSFTELIEASKCSSVPNSLRADSDNLDSLASQMAAAVFTMRYPVHKPVEPSRELLDMSLAKDVLKAPSAAGFAFAILLICLPMMKSKDVSVCASVAEVVANVVGHFTEPVVQITNGSQEDTSLGSIISGKRAQVLLNRLESLLGSFQSISMPKLSNEDISSDAFSWLLTSVTCNILTSFPLIWLASGVNAEPPELCYADIDIVGPKTVKCCSIQLAMGPVTVRTIREIGIHAKSGLLLEVSDANKISALLRVVDRKFEESLEHVFELLNQADSLQVALTRPGVPDNLTEREVVSYFNGLVRSLVSCTSLIYNALSTKSTAPIQRQLLIAETVPVLLCTSVAYKRHRKEIAMGEHIDSILNVLLTIMKFGTPHHKCRLIGSLVHMLCPKASVARLGNQSSNLSIGNVLSEAMANYCSFSVDQQQLLQFLVFRRIVPQSENFKDEDSSVSCLLASIVSSLFGYICTPSFIHVLVVEGVMSSSTANVEDMNSSVLLDFQCLQVMSMVMLEELTNFAECNNAVSVHTADQWVVLLPILKVIAWSGEAATAARPASTETAADDSSPNVSADCVWERQIGELVAIMPSFNQFLLTLEDACSSRKQCLAQWRATQTLGLFHKFSNVRAKCCLLLRRELLKSFSLLGTHRLATPEVDDAGLLLNDPLRTAEKVPLSEYPSCEPPSVGLSNVSMPSADTVGRRVTTHSDLRKLVAIAFNKTCETNVRCAAATQATLAVHDDYLLSTADYNWLVDVTKRCVSHIAEIVWDPKQFILQDIGLAKCIIQFMKTVVFSHLLIRQNLKFYIFESVESATGQDVQHASAATVWNVDGSLTFDRSADGNGPADAVVDSGGIIDILPLLKAVFVKTAGIENGSPPNAGGDGPSSGLRDVRNMILQIIFAAAVECYSWSLCDNFRNSVCESIMAPIDVTVSPSEFNGQTRNAIGVRSMSVPQLLLHSLVFPLGGNSFTDRTSVKTSARQSSVLRQQQRLRDTIQVSRLYHREAAPQSARPLLSASMIQQAHESRTCSLSMSKLRNLSGRLVEDIKRSPSHSKLRESIQLAASFVASVPVSLGFASMLLDANIADSLRRILHTTPSTEKDLVTLSHALLLIQAILAHSLTSKSSPLTEGLHTLAHTCWLSILGPMLGILRNPMTDHQTNCANYVSEGMATNGTARAGNNLFSLQETQFLLFSCLKAIVQLCTFWKKSAVHSHQGEIIRPLLVSELSRHSISVLLGGVLTMERIETRARSVAGEALIELINFHEAVSVLQTDAAVADPRGQYSLLKNASSKMYTRRLERLVSPSCLNKADKLAEIASEFGENGLAQCSIRDLILSARLVRVPDSFKGTKSLATILAVLYSIQSNHLYEIMAHTNAALSSGELFNCSNEFNALIDMLVSQHQLLLRLCYDRRSGIRLLAVDIVRQLLCTKAGYLALCTLCSEGTSTVAVQDNVSVNCVSHQDLSRSRTSLFEHLYHIGTDSSEAPAVRATILSMLFKRLQNQIGSLVHDHYRNTDATVPEILAENDMESLGFCCRELDKLFIIAGELLSTSNEFNTSSSIIQDVLCTINTFCQFMSSPRMVVGLLIERKAFSRGRDQGTSHIVSILQTEVGKALSRNRILQHLSGLLNPCVPAGLLSSSLGGCHLASVMPNFERNETVQNFVGDHCDADLGWGHEVNVITEESRRNYYSCQGYICNFLLFVCKSYEDLFRQCIQQTNGSLILNIVSGMTESHLYAKSIDRADDLSSSNSLSCMHMNLLCYLLMKSTGNGGPCISSDRHPSNATSETRFECIDVASPHKGAADRIGKENSLIPTQVLEYVANRLRLLTQQLNNISTNILTQEGGEVIVSMFASASACSTACFRLLTVMLDNTQWRAKLAFGSDSDFASGSVTAMSVVRSLSFIRSILNDKRIVALMNPGTDKSSSRSSCKRQELMKLIKPIHLSITSRVVIVVAVLANYSCASRKIFAGMSEIHSAGKYDEELSVVNVSCNKESLAYAGEAAGRMQQLIKLSKSTVKNTASASATKVSNMNKDKISLLKETLSPSKGLSKRTTSSTGKWLVTETHESLMLKCYTAGGRR
jgi:hypothetical protein